MAHLIAAANASADSHIQVHYCCLGWALKFLRNGDPAAVFLARRREGLEIDNPKADDCLSI
jgi:hypothetical protein